MIFMMARSLGMEVGVTWIKSLIVEGCAILEMEKTSEEPATRNQA